MPEENRAIREYLSVEKDHRSVTTASRLDTRHFSANGIPQVDEVAAERVQRREMGDPEHVT